MAAAKKRTLTQSKPRGTEVTLDGTDNVVIAYKRDMLGMVYNDVYATGFSLCDDGAATSRNAGSNPSSLTADVPQLGAVFTASVDLTTSGHSLAGLIGYFSPASIPLPGGQVLLVNVFDPGGEVFGLGLGGGNPATFSLSVPNDPSLCGASVSTQAIHVGGVTPFALSNAVDLVIGAI